MTGLAGKIRIDEDDLPFAEERLHGIVPHLHGEGALPWNVCFKERSRMDQARRLVARDHLVKLMIPPQERHLPHLAEGSAMGILREFELSFEFGEPPDRRKFA